MKTCRYVRKYKDAIAYRDGHVSMSNLIRFKDSWYTFLMQLNPTFSCLQKYLQSDIPNIDAMALALKSMGYEITFE